MTDLIQPGWHPDPFGQRAHRYFDGATWTEHVADEGATTTGAVPPPPPPAAPRTMPPTNGATTPIPGTAAVVTLPDSPQRSHKRKLCGFALLGAAGVMFASLALPWVSSQDGSVTLAGHEVSAGSFVGLCAILLGLYGAQGVWKPRVRHHVVAVCLLALAMIGTFGAKALLDEDQVDRLSEGTEADASFFGIQVIDADEVKREASTEVGLNIAFLAQLGAIAPLAVLWKDDRERRREAGLLL